MPRWFALIISVLAFGLVSLAAPAQDDEVVELSRAATPRGTPTAVLDGTSLEHLSILGFAPGYEPSGPVDVSLRSPSIGMQPGGSLILVLGVFDFESCGPVGFPCFTPAPVTARWSITPAAGAHIDAATGVLTIDPATPNGRVFTVRADVASGRRGVETEVHVYTPEANPLLGFWREEAQLPCGGGEDVVPTEPIEELAFDSDGTFAVTWFRFESYVDYYGTYAFDLARGTLELVVTGGNSIPADVDGEGRFAVDATGRLILSDLWLGTPASGQRLGTPAASTTSHSCGHRFVVQEIGR